MAANTSPSLTNSSHTMTALPLVSVPPISPTGINGENNKVLLALLESLRPDKRHVFLQPSDALPTGSLNVVKETLEGFAAEVGEEQEVRLKESRKRKRKKRRGEIDVLKLRRVYVDGFETEQVWQQARRIIGSVLEFSDGLLDELEEEGEVVAAGQVDGRDDEKEEEEESEDIEDIEGEEEEDDEEELEVELDEDQLEDGLEGEDDEDLDELEDGLEDELNEDEDEEDEEEQDVEEYVEDPDGLNDGFFNLEEFNRQSQYFEEQDARGDPNTDRASDDEDVDWDADPMAEPKAGSKKSSNRKSQDDDQDPLQDEDDEDDDEEDGPTFGDMALDAPEGESDDEALNDEAADDEGMDFNANEVYFKDFFAPPPRKSKGGKPKKSVRFQPEEPTKEDVDRAMADVRRDLFDDESDNDDSEDALSDVSAGDPKSRRSAHERRQLKLAEEIRKLEAASVAKREWALSGEAAAVDRPVNSLLEEDLDFEHVGKPVPVITPEVTEGIEDMIKRRILAQQFDEVLRRRPDAEAVPSGTRRGIVEVDDSKSSKGLAEVYEEEHVKNANPDAYVSQSDEKLQREEKEIEAMWKDVSSRLDALSSWNYRPKPSAATVSVVSDVAAVAMEDAQPTTASAISGESSRLAPQEVYKAGAGNAVQGEVVTSGGMPLARQELSREDKVRRRRREKERMRKAGGADAVGTTKTTTNGAGGAKKTLSAKAKMQRETIAELKKGGVKVINRKGEITDVEGKKTKVAAKIVSGGSYKL